MTYDMQVACVIAITVGFIVCTTLAGLVVALAIEHIRERRDNA